MLPQHFRALAVLLAIVAATVATGIQAQTPQPQPQQVPSPGSASLAPGEQVTFIRPAPAQGGRLPGGLPPPAVFARVNVEVENSSDQPLNLTDDSGNLTVAAPNGFTVQVLNLQRQPGVGPIAFSGCSPDGSQTNVVTCKTPGSSPTGGGTILLTVMLVPDDAGPQTVSLPPGGNVALVGPAAATTPSGDVPAVTVSNGSDQPATLTWDGSSLTIAVADGLAVSVDTFEGANPPREIGQRRCQSVDGGWNVVSCPLVAVPPAEVFFDTVIPAPEGTLVLPYTDADGPGTLTIANVGPDVAPGGASVTVELDQNGATLAGQGVIRPQRGSAFRLAFSLSSSDGEISLFDGTLSLQGDTWTGQGLWLAETEPARTDAWSLGGASPTGAETGALLLSASSPPPPESFPSRGDLPHLIGSRLLGVAPGSGPQLSPVDPPVTGTAGQPVGFVTSGTAPCCGGGATETFEWLFGDGNRSPPSRSPHATHIYTAPGVYTIAAIVTDETGVSSFSASRIRIQPAPADASESGPPRRQS